MSQTTNYRSEIEEIMDQFGKAANAKDADAIAGLYTDDATLLPPGQAAIKGKDNIRDFWHGFMNSGVNDPTVKTVAVDGYGDLAYEIGEWTAIMPAPDGGSGRTTGKYLVVYKRQKDGSLKMVADMFGPNI